MLSRISLSRVLSILLVVMILLSSAAFPTHVRAAGPITVNSIDDTTVAGDGHCTLREAITNANSNSDTTSSDCVAGSGNDTIVFDAALGTATITLGSILPHISDAAGLTINGGTDITVSGNYANEAFWVDTGFSLTLDGITITKGVYSVIANSGTLNILNSNVSYNTNAMSSGVVVNNLGTLTITNSNISNNTGGGVISNGTLIITNSTFSNNHSDGNVGGVFSAGALTITNSNFSNNSNNGDGGGVHWLTGIDTPLIMNSTFIGNSATHYGGGIYSYGNMTVANSTFSNNSAAFYGGGIYNEMSVLTIINSTFSANSAAIGDGIYNNATLNLYNTILANSVNGGDCRNNLAYGIVNGNNNLIEATGRDACGLVNGVNSNIVGADPNLGLITGAPAYFPLNSGSPTIDAGDDAICAAAPVNNTSQNGLIRPQGAHCDIGSYEYHAPIFADVLASYWAYSYIDRLYNAGITGGCGASPLIYCPDATVTRAQMAIFLLRGMHGSAYNPPAVGGSTGFNDVAPTDFAAAWIKQLALEGITGGCGPSLYCPNATVTRAQMAIFLLRGEHGSGYTPPAVGASTGFNDVAPTDFAAAWIKQLALEGITGGCAPSLYCPAGSVTRAEMAIFLVRAFSLP